MRGGEQSGGGIERRLGTLAWLLVLAATLAAPPASFAASKWSVRQLPAKQLVDDGGSYRALLYATSCPSESLCIAVGALDTVAVSQAPTAGVDAWRVVNPSYAEPQQGCLDEGLSEPACRRPRGAIDAISCPNESLCVAVGYEGSVYASSAPTGAADAWSVTDLRGSPHLTGVSCPSASLCVAVSGGTGRSTGNVLTSTAPTTNEWEATQLPGAPDLSAVSCPTPSLCVAVAKGGRIFVSSDPAAGAAAWREAASPTTRDLRAVSCVAPGFCAAGDAGGNILTSTDPGGAPFAATNADGSVLVTGMSCPTALRCVAVDNNSDVLTSTDPTGGPGAWTFENLVPFVASYPDTGQFVGNALFGASCASTSLCVLVGAESRIFTSTDPFAAPAPPSPGGSAGRKRARLRPRTHLVFAEGFWRSSSTRRRHVKARFRFYSRDGARAFLCKRDRGRWHRCHSPLRYWAPVGRHVLRVRAIGRTGLRGPVARMRFTVVHPH
jgi:hypothetical protein